MDLSSVTSVQTQSMVAKQLCNQGADFVISLQDDTERNAAAKICNDNGAAWTEFLARLEKVCEKYEVQCITTSSIDQAALPKELEKYVF